MVTEASSLSEGLMPGDHVLSLNGTPVSHLRDLQAEAERLAAEGGAINLLIARPTLRSGAGLVRAAVVAADATDALRRSCQPVVLSQRLGSSAALRHGFMVVGELPQPLAAAGVAPGDVILTVNGHRLFRSSQHSALRKLREHFSGHPNYLLTVTSVSRIQYPQDHAGAYQQAQQPATQLPSAPPARRHAAQPSHTGTAPAGATLGLEATGGARPPPASSAHALSSISPQAGAWQPAVLASTSISATSRGLGAASPYGTMSAAHAAMAAARMPLGPGLGGYSASSSVPVSRQQQQQQQQQQHHHHHQQQQHALAESAGQAACPLPVSTHLSSTSPAAELRAGDPLATRVPVQPGALAGATSRGYQCSPSSQPFSLPSAPAPLPANSYAEFMARHRTPASSAAVPSSAPPAAPPMHVQTSSGSVPQLPHGLDIAHRAFLGAGSTLVPIRGNGSRGRGRSWDAAPHSTPQAPHSAPSLPVQSHVPPPLGPPPGSHGVPSSAAASPSLPAVAAREFPEARADAQAAPSGRLWAALAAQRVAKLSGSLAWTVQSSSPSADSSGAAGSGAKSAAFASRYCPPLPLSQDARLALRLAADSSRHTAVAVLSSMSCFAVDLIGDDASPAASHGLVEALHLAHGSQVMTWTQRRLARLRAQAGAALGRPQRGDPAVSSSVNAALGWLSPTHDEAVVCEAATAASEETPGDALANAFKSARAAQTKRAWLRRLRKEVKVRVGAQPRPALRKQSASLLSRGVRISCGIPVDSDAAVVFRSRMQSLEGADRAPQRFVRADARRVSDDEVFAQLAAAARGGVLSVRPSSVEPPASRPHPTGLALRASLRALRCCIGSGLPRPALPGGAFPPLLAKRLSQCGYPYRHPPSAACLMCHPSTAQAGCCNNAREGAPVWRCGGCGLWYHAECIAAGLEPRAAKPSLCSVCCWPQYRDACASLVKGASSDPAVERLARAVWAGLVQRFVAFRTGTAQPLPEPDQAEAAPSGGDDSSSQAAGGPPPAARPVPQPSSQALWALAIASDSIRSSAWPSATAASRASQLEEAAGLAPGPRSQCGQHLLALAGAGQDLRDTLEAAVLVAEAVVELINGTRSRDRPRPKRSKTFGASVQQQRSPELLNALEAALLAQRPAAPGSHEQRSRGLADAVLALVGEPASPLAHAAPGEPQQACLPGDPGLSWASLVAAEARRVAQATFASLPPALVPSVESIACLLAGESTEQGFARTSSASFSGPALAVSPLSRACSGGVGMPLSCFVADPHTGAELPRACERDAACPDWPSVAAACLRCEDGWATSAGEDAGGLLGQALRPERYWGLDPWLLAASDESVSAAAASLTLDPALVPAIALVRRAALVRPLSGSLSDLETRPLSPNLPTVADWCSALHLQLGPSSPALAVTSASEPEELAEADPCPAVASGPALAPFSPEAPCGAFGIEGFRPGPTRTAVESMLCDPPHHGLAAVFSLSASMLARTALRVAAVRLETGVAKLPAPWRRVARALGQLETVISGSSRPALSRVASTLNPLPRRMVCGMMPDASADAVVRSAFGTVSELAGKAASAVAARRRLVVAQAAPIALEWLCVHGLAKPAQDAVPESEQALSPPPNGDLSLLAQWVRQRVAHGIPAAGAPRPVRLAVAEACAKAIGALGSMGCTGAALQHAARAFQAAASASLPAKAGSRPGDAGAPASGSSAAQGVPPPSEAGSLITVIRAASMALEVSTDGSHLDAYQRGRLVPASHRVLAACTATARSKEQAARLAPTVATLLEAAVHLPSVGSVVQAAEAARSSLWRAARPALDGSSALPSHVRELLDWDWQLSAALLMAFAQLDGDASSTVAEARQRLRALEESIFACGMGGVEVAKALEATQEGRLAASWLQDVSGAAAAATALPPAHQSAAQARSAAATASSPQAAASPATARARSAAKTADDRDSGSLGAHAMPLLSRRGRSAVAAAVLRSPDILSLQPHERTERLRRSIAEGEQARQRVEEASEGFGPATRRSVVSLAAPMRGRTTELLIRAADSLAEAEAAVHATDARAAVGIPTGPSRVNLLAMMAALRDTGAVLDPETGRVARVPGIAQAVDAIDAMLLGGQQLDSARAVAARTGDSALLKLGAAVKEAVPAHSLFRKDPSGASASSEAAGGVPPVAPVVLDSAPRRGLLQLRSTLAVQACALLAVASPEGGPQSDQRRASQPPSSGCFAGRGAEASHPPARAGAAGAPRAVSQPAAPDTLDAMERLEAAVPPDREGFVMPSWSGRCFAVDSTVRGGGAAERGPGSKGRGRGWQGSVAMDAGAVRGSALDGSACGRPGCEGSCRPGSRYCSDACGLITAQAALVRSLAPAAARGSPGQRRERDSCGAAAAGAPPPPPRRPLGSSILRRSVAPAANGHVREPPSAGHQAGAFPAGLPSDPLALIAVLLWTWRRLQAATDRLAEFELKAVANTLGLGELQSEAPPLGVPNDDSDSDNADDGRNGVEGLAGPSEGGRGHSYCHANDDADDGSAPSAAEPAARDGPQSGPSVPGCLAGSEPPSEWRARPLAAGDGGTGSGLLPPEAMQHVKTEPADVPRAPRGAGVPAALVSKAGCPVCGRSFLASRLPRHLATCGRDLGVGAPSTSWSASTAPSGDRPHVRRHAQAMGAQSPGPDPVLDSRGRVVIPVAALAMGQAEPHESGRARPTRPCGRPRCLVPRVVPQHPDAAYAYAESSLPQPAHWSVSVGLVAAAAGADGAACLSDLERSPEDGAVPGATRAALQRDALPPSPFGPATGCPVREAHCSLHHGWEAVLFRRLVAAKGIVRDRVRLWVRLHGRDASSCDEAAGAKGPTSAEDGHRVSFVALGGGAADPGAFSEAAKPDGPADPAATLGLPVGDSPTEEIPGSRSSLADEQGRSLLQLHAASADQSTAQSEADSVGPDRSGACCPAEPLDHAGLGIGAASPGGSRPSSRSSWPALGVFDSEAPGARTGADERPLSPQPGVVHPDSRGASKRPRDESDGAPTALAAKRVLRGGH